MQYSKPRAKKEEVGFENLFLAVGSHGVRLLAIGVEVENLNEVLSGDFEQVLVSVVELNILKVVETRVLELCCWLLQVPHVPKFCASSVSSCKRKTVFFPSNLRQVLKERPFQSQ